MNVYDKILMEYGSFSAFSKLIGLHQNCVYKWRKVGRIPLKRVKQIEVATDGKITREMLLPELFAKENKA